MPESKSTERLVFFSDAVVAIALTLLVLPLADAVPEAVSQHQTVIDMMVENQWKIYTFVLSFAVIARLWITHHQLFEKIKYTNYPLMVVNFVWLFTIVLLPFVTEMSGGFKDNQFTAACYIGTVLAASVCQLLLILLSRNDYHIAINGEGVPEPLLFASVTNTGILVVAFMLASLVPGVTYYAILLLLLTPLASRLRYKQPLGNAPF